MRPPRSLDRILPSAHRGAHHDYAPFIVLTSARSGSSFLCQSLRSHPQIIAFGEILGPGNVWFNVPGYPTRHRGLKRFRDGDPLAFLDACVFNGYDANIRAVGFKVFFSHLEDARFVPLREHLGRMSGLRVIRLERANLLRAYLSTVLLGETGVGWIHSEGERRPVSVSLDPGACERYFRQHIELRETYGRVFEACDQHRIRYEDLVANYAEETTRIQTFLGVDPRELSSEIMVQEVRPLAEAITNFAELERRFRGTPWGEFLV